MEHKKNFSLKDHNTLKIDVTCDNFYRIDAANEIALVADILTSPNEKNVILGGGANILFVDDFHGNVFQYAAHEITKISEDADSVILSVDAGVDWPKLVEYTVERGWGGIENMALIPGSVGAAAIGNIAAYSQEFSGTCVGVRAYEFTTGKIVDVPLETCDFRYRESAFKHELKGKYMIVQVSMKLSKNPKIHTDYWSKKHGSFAEELKKRGDGPYSVKDMYEIIVAMRTAKFPDMNQYGTAGSFFKNPFVSKEELKRLNELVPNVQYYPITGMHYIPNDGDPDDYVKIASGEILDRGMGYKGKWEGNVGLYEQHALTLVTNGMASGKEVDSFATKVENDFYEFCGIRLEREVRTIHSS